MDAIIRYCQHFIFSLKPKTNLCDEKSRKEKHLRQKTSTMPTTSPDVTRRRSTLKSRTKSAKSAEPSKAESKKSSEEKFRVASPSKFLARPARPIRRLRDRILCMELQWKSQSRLNLQRQSASRRPLLRHLHLRQDRHSSK